MQKLEGEIVLTLRMIDLLLPPSKSKYLTDPTKKRKTPSDTALKVDKR